MNGYQHFSLIAKELSNFHSQVALTQKGVAPRELAVFENVRRVRLAARLGHRHLTWGHG